MSNYYQIWDEVRKLPTLTADKRAEVVEQISTPASAKEYSYASIVAEAFKYLTKDETLKVFDNMVAHHAARRSYYETHLFSSIKIAYDFDPAHAKAQILKSTGDSYHKALLMMDGLTTDEEAMGLRALSNSKYCPPIIHEAKYAPSKEAIDLLPPVMRLKVLETLSNNRHLAYNIFAHFPDPDEFKTLMFSSVMRHRDRAEVVWNKYQEIANYGKAGQVLIKGSCNNCGEFEVVVKSTRIRTKTGLQTTNLWNSFRYGCALCGVHSGKPIEVIGQDNEQGTD